MSLSLLNFLWTLNCIILINALSVRFPSYLRTEIAGFQLRSGVNPITTATEVSPVFLAYDNHKLP